MSYRLKELAQAYIQKLTENFPFYFYLKNHASIATKDSPIHSYFHDLIYLKMPL